MFEILVDVLRGRARIIGRSLEVSEVGRESSNGSFVRKEQRISVVERQFSLV